MRPSQSVILIVLIIVLSIGCVPSKEQTIKFAENKFEIIKPKSWKTMTDLNDEADIQMGNLFKEAYLIIISEARADFSEDVTLDYYSNLTADAIKESLGNRRVSEPELLEINGNPAIKYVLEGTIDKIKVKYWHISVETSEHLHQIIIWSLPSRFEKNKKAFEQALNSFREL